MQNRHIIIVCIVYYIFAHIACTHCYMQGLVISIIGAIGYMCAALPSVVPIGSTIASWIFRNVKDLIISGTPFKPAVLEYVYIISAGLFIVSYVILVYIQYYT